MADDDTINEVEVFRATDELTAQIAIDEVLGPAGIDATIHNRTSHAFPAPASMPGGYFIAVAESDARAAVEALKEAQTAGVLPADAQINDQLLA
jgi:hypothetical protein